MSILLKAYLPDTPGVLIQVLKPISDNSGNIHSVIHSHDDKVGAKVPVIIQFSLPHEKDREEQSIENIKKELEKQSIEIIKLSKELKRERITLILIGHVFETDFVDTMKRIANTEAKVNRIDARFTSIEHVSNVKFEILVDLEHLDNAMDEIRKICKEKDLKLITDR